MSYLSRSSDSQGGGLSSRPVALSLAVVVIIALLALVALRFAFGSIRVEAGVR